MLTPSPKSSFLFKGAWPTGRLEIYPYDRILRRDLKRVQDSSSIRREDKVRIKGFAEHLLAKGVSKPRVIKYVNQLAVLARMVEKPFERLKRRDIEELVRKINESGYSEHTKRDFKIVLKRFYQWLRDCNEDENEYPEEVRWIKTSPKEKR
ncbi:MAG: hypothetical protein DRO43_05600, partial [Candidatus Hecatellales archaeon]